MVHAVTAGGNGVSFGVENVGASLLDFTMDCSDARNCASHRGALCYRCDVAPGETRLLHHLSPKTSGAWSWSYECEWRRPGEDGS